MDLGTQTRLNLRFNFANVGSRAGYTWASQSQAYLGWGAGKGHPQIFSISSHLCFKKWCPKHNTVARLRSNILIPQIFVPPKKIWAGYATALS